MDFSGLVRRAGKFASDNSPAILTAVGVTTTLTAAYLTGKASFQAAEIIAKENRDRRLHDEPEVDLREAVNMCWRLYLPPAGAVVVSIGCIIAANQIGSKRTAALAAGFAITEKAFDEYKNKVVEKVGDKKERGYRTEIAQQRVADEPPPEDLVYIEGGRTELCCDLFTGRYFMCDMETLRSAENQINHNLVHDYYASLTQFYELIGLTRTSFTDDVGWNVDKMLELDIQAVLTPSGRPCLAIDFRVAPIRGYSRMS